MLRTGLDLIGRQAREGDESAFEEIMRRYSPRVLSLRQPVSFVSGVSGRSSAEVFLKALRTSAVTKSRFDGRLADTLTTTLASICCELEAGV